MNMDRERENERLALRRGSEVLEDAAAELEEEAAEAGWDGNDSLEADLLLVVEKVRDLRRQFNQRAER